MTSESVAFFYGTLMHPTVLKRVINNDAGHCRISPGILLNYTRHQVIGHDYPGLLPYPRAQVLLGEDLDESDRCVRGSLVYGLTAEDMHWLDIFEGNEYTRYRVSAHPLSEPEPLQTSSMHTLPASPPLPDTGSLVSPITAWAYIWTAPISRLAPDIWSYEVFVREKLWRWIGDDTPDDVAQDYNEVDKRRHMNGIIVAEDVGSVHRSMPSSEFGHVMLPHFCFAAGYINLNHGSYGSLPRPVLEATEVLALEAEARPDKFMRRTYLTLLNVERERLAKLVKAETDECVIVPNATHGINTVLLNVDWQADDVIVAFTTTYGAVSSTLRAIRDRPPHPSLKIIPLVYPISHAHLIELFRSELRAIPRREDQKILAIIDGIVSTPGVLMPWEALVEVCREEKVWSLVDGAHLIGQVNVDLSASKPDFWVSNCHKWLLSKRGSALLYVPRRNQHIIKITLPISIGYVSPQDPPPVLTGSERFVRLFEWTGTIDYVPFLSVGPAMDFRESIGGETKINAYCHALALQGGCHLASVLGTRVMDENGELTANMTNVLLPLPVPKELPRAKLNEILTRMQDMLLDDHNCFAGLYLHNDKWWVRCSAQIWNEISDFDYLGRALLDICARMQDEQDEEARGRTPVTRGENIQKEDVVGTAP